MKKSAVLMLALFCLTAIPPSWAKDERETPPNTNTKSSPPSQQHPTGGESENVNVGYGQERESGIFLGGDTGAFIPFGHASHGITPQFLSSIDFGYMFKRRLSLQARLLTGYGQTERTSAGVFLFMFEADAKYNFRKAGLSPFLFAGVGMYLLSFSGFDPFVAHDTNLTFVGGSGFDYIFGSNSVGLNINYRGFNNKAHYLQGMETLVSYTYRFF